MVGPDFLGQCLAHDSSEKLASQIMRWHYQIVDKKNSGVGVIDKAVRILNALESGPKSLSQLVSETKIARPTAHRLAVALEHHRFAARDFAGKFILGPRFSELSASVGEDKLLSVANPILQQLRDKTGESAQLYRRHGNQRICVASAERMSGLRDSVPVGTVLTMQAGSAAQILLAWEEADRLHPALLNAKFDATLLSAVRRRGWAQSVGEREAGVASVSAAIKGAGNKVVAAISISGPIERLGRQPGRLHSAAVVAAAEKLSSILKN
jgi:DNA-binding IclR family transcriptional regulator